MKASSGPGGQRPEASLLEVALPLVLGDRNDRPLLPRILVPRPPLLGDGYPYLNIPRLEKAPNTSALYVRGLLSDSTELWA